ncbi:MAG: sigma-70 family RNA polymerase sigma factor [Planctomycetes bacterium]|nr:sigma-70 family RNA polymerase sigma factor [Planctomycetota bacterium]
MIEVDEEALLEGCRRGESAAYQRLYARYSAQVYAFARRFLGDEQHAEDVTQEVFLRVFRKLDSFRGEAKFSTWLFRVTVNSCRNKRRTLERVQRFDAERFQGSRPDREPPPERTLMSWALGDRIGQALSRLTEEQRTLLLLKAVEELSYQEIGVLVGQNENQVRGKLYRARKAFKLSLAELGESYAEQSSAGRLATVLD